MKKFFILLLPVLALFASSQIPSINQIMSIEDQKATGVIRLTQEQKKALASWLVKNGYYQNEAEENFNNLPRVSLNINSGTKIVLSDNTVWEVAPDDQVIASAWLSSIPVKITPSTSQEYPFIMTNLNNRIGIKVKKSSI